MARVCYQRHKKRRLPSDEGSGAPPLPAALSAEGRNLAVNPQTDQVKNKQTEKNVRTNKKWTPQPLQKKPFGCYGLVRFERSFVKDRAGLIFDPGRINFGSLVPDNLKRFFQIVGFGFDYSEICH